MAPKKTTPATTSKGQASRGKARVMEYETSDDSGSGEEYFPGDEEVLDTSQKKRKIPQQVVLQRFCNADAQEKFCDFAIRHIHVERAFGVTENPYIETIHYYNWQKLTEAPSSCNVAIAKEFYANAAGAEAKDVISKGVFIRGKYLKLTPQLVNKHYGLKDYPHDQITDLRKTGDPDAILRELSLPGTDWERTHHGEPRFANLKDLTTEAKMWLLFINSRLMPTTHNTRISKNRLFLVYAIKNRMTVDVGKFIITYINNALAENHPAMYFPHFLYEQAVKLGVKVAGGDESRNPVLPVKNGQIRLYQAQEKTEREQREEEARERERAEQEHEMDDIDVEEPQAGSARPQPNPQPLQAFGNFQHMQHALEGLQTSIQNQQDSLTQHFNGLEGRWTALQDCMGIIGTRIDTMVQEQTTQWTTMDNKITQCQTEVHNLNLMMVHHHQSRGPDSYFPPLDEMDSHARMIVDTSSSRRVVMQQGISSSGAGPNAANLRPAQIQFPGFSHFAGQSPPT